jgi:hypothetical protein
MNDRKGGPGRPDGSLVESRLKTPRAAAIAGIVFSILMIASLLMLRLSIPADPHAVGPWLRTNRQRVLLALNLVPFAGIAFMWFLGVLRDRLGAREDQFFATVFLGSGLMFLGMVFVAASAIGALVAAYAVVPQGQVTAGAFSFARAFAYDIMHIYAFKMAAVFMITTSTVLLYTHVTARWIAIIGYAAAATILIVSGFSEWALFVFPFWVLLVSLYILIDNLRRPGRAQMTGQLP